MTSPRIIASPFADIAIPDVPLTPFVLQRAAAMPNKLAIVCGVTGRSYTYGELALAVQRVAAGLQAHGSPRAMWSGW
jgi:acyl-CoA synthetase (AMP-forming)/AMP-acid ligase II